MQSEAKVWQRTIFPFAADERSYRERQFNIAVGRASGQRSEVWKFGGLWK